MANSVISLRINITEAHSGSYVGAGEVRVKNSSGVYISLASATFTASSTYSNWYPSKLKDGSTVYGTHTWVSDGLGFPQWVNVAFSAAVDAATVEIVNTDPSASNESIKAGDIVATHTGGDTTTVTFSTRTNADNGVSAHTIPPLAATFEAKSSPTSLDALPLPAAYVQNGIAAFSSPTALDALPLPAAYARWFTAKSSPTILDALPLPAAYARWFTAKSSPTALDALPLPAAYASTRALVLWSKPAALPSLPLPAALLRQWSRCITQPASLPALPLPTSFCSVVYTYNPIAPITPTTARPLLLSDKIPLRRTTEMPTYRNDAVIPWGYGRVTLQPISADDAGLLWLLFDHPIEAITGVSAGGIPVSGYELIHTIDHTGRTQSFMRLTQPPKDGKPLSVSVAGKRNTSTGELITHPADVVRDLLAACGWVLTPDAFDGLRTDYPGVDVGGIFAEAKPLREAIREVMQSIGAIWSGEPLQARAAWSTPAPRATLNYELNNVSAKADSTGLANVLRLTFAHDYAANRPAQTLILAAPALIDDMGEIPLDMDLPWLRTARDALALGTAILQNAARPEWIISTDVDDAQDWQPGENLVITHELLPQGTATITALEADQVTTALTLSMRAGNAPRIEIASRGKAIDAAITDNPIVYKDGQATFTITDDAGAPIADAAVTLDGQDTRNTGRDGRVTFKTTRGAHTLSVVAFGYAPFEIEVQV